MNNWHSINTKYQKIKKHIFIGSILLIYLFFANAIYVDFFLKNGKPAEKNTDLPPTTNNVTFDLSEPRLIRYDGEDLYELRGFAFETLDPKKQMQIKIVLHSAREDLIFSTDTYSYPELVRKYAKYEPFMDKTEFRMLFSKSVLKTDNYQIGILLEEKEGSSRYYQLTGRYIERTPNTIRFVSDY